MQPTDLVEHPEGGRFREVFRSDARVSVSGRDSHSALTHIYFSLDAGEVSRFHRVRSDEVWNLYRGGLNLYTWDGTDSEPVKTVLSPSANTFCHVVTAGQWQAAEPLEGGVLAGCSVGPGFEFDDFELMDPASQVARQLLSIDPRIARLLGLG